MTQQKSIPELSVDTQIIEGLLRTASIGDVVTYESMSAAIKRDVQKEGRGNLRTARRRLHKIDHMVFGAVTNMGVKRLNDEGKSAAARGHAHRGRNQFKQASVTATAVDDFGKLPNHLKIEHNVIVAQAGALLHMTSAKSTKALEGKIGDDALKSFKPKESLELMKASL